MKIFFPLGLAILRSCSASHKRGGAANSHQAREVERIYQCRLTQGTPAQSCCRQERSCLRWMWAYSRTRTAARPTHAIWTLLLTRHTDPTNATTTPWVTDLNITQREGDYIPARYAYALKRVCVRQPVCKSRHLHDCPGGGNISISLRYDEEKDTYP